MWLRLFMFLVFMLAAVSAGAETQVFQVHHRAPVEIVTQVRQLLDEGEKAVVAGQTIIVIGDRDFISASGELISALDRVPQQLLIRVANERSSLVAGERTGSPAHHKNARILGNSTERTEHKLLVQEGHQARIEVGKDIPYTEEWAVFSGDIEGYREKTGYQKISTGFWVMPVQVVGNRVLIAIEPWFMSASSSYQEAPVKDFSRYHTQVYVPLDQWIQLGGLFREDQMFSKAVIASRAGGDNAREDIFIRIERQERFSP